MLSFESIEDCFPDGHTVLEDGNISVSAQWLHDFAHRVVASAQMHAIVDIVEREMRAIRQSVTGPTFPVYYQIQNALDREFGLTEKSNG